MKIRFTLDPKIDAKLIARIEQKAGGGPTNEAAKFLMRFWHELESGQDVTPECQDLPSARQNVSPESETGDINLSGLDSINLEF